jgi:acyl carrier protein
MTTQQRLLKALSRSGVSAEIFEPDFSKPFIQIGLDSLDVYSFFTEIELEMGVKILDEDIPELVSMEKVLKYVSERIKS